MSNKLTDKQEAFAQEYVKNKGNASAAYRHAYDAENMKPESIWSEASILLKNPGVSARIEELKQEAAAKYEITMEEVVDGLRDARTMSYAEKDIGNLRGSSMDLAKIGGLIIDQSKVTVEQKDTVEQAKEKIRKLEKKTNERNGDDR